MKELVSGTFSRLKKTKILSNFVNLSSIQLSNALLLILLYPVITRIVGLEAFGLVMVANAFAGLMGTLVNYGTIQSSVKEVAILHGQEESQSGVVINTLFIRLGFFLLVVLLLSFSGFFIGESYLFYVLSLPLIFAEVVNPMFFYLGVQNLKAFNIANLVSKVSTVLLILFIIRGPEDAIWVNFLMGSVLSFTYIFLVMKAVNQYNLEFTRPTMISQKRMIRNNFFLLINNLAVHLQQSLMLFGLQRWGSAELLGAYSLGDKVVWSSRMLLISISNAVYPRAAQLFIKGRLDWIAFKNKIKLGVGCLFLLGSLFLFLFPEFIIHILIGEANPIAVLFLRNMAFVPFIAALNLMNVLDRLLHNDNFSIFKIALIILFISSLITYLLISYGNYQAYGYYPLAIEVCALLFYEIQIRSKQPDSILVPEKL